MTFNVFASLVDLLIFSFRSIAKSHHSQKGYTLKLVELQDFLNEVVTDSLHVGGFKPTTGSSTTHGGGQPPKKRTYEPPLVGASKRWKRNNGACFGRGRGRGGGQGDRGRTSPNTSRIIDFCAIAGALTPEERKRHIEERV
jgi:hypothetical protein